jgi:hypothetical protein
MTDDLTVTTVYENGLLVKLFLRKRSWWERLLARLGAV